MKIRGTDFVYYQTGDIDRAITFYRDTLGLELAGYYEQMRWAEFDAGNTTLVLNDPSILGVGIEPRPGGGAAALAVEDLAAAMEELEGKQVTVVFPAQESPICHLSCIEGPDGNHVWLHQRKDGTFG